MTKEFARPHLLGAGVFLFPSVTGFNQTQNHRFGSLVENELFCMTIAKAITLNGPRLL